MGRLILGEDLGARMLEISTKSYRPVTRGQRGDRGRSKPVPELRGRRDHRPPRPRPVGIVERREDLSAPRVDHRQARSVTPLRVLRDSLRQRIERADPGQWLPESLGEPARRRDPDPQSGERPGPDPDRDRVDAVPSPGDIDHSLDLAEKLRGVARWGPGIRPDAALDEDLSAAGDRDRDVGGRCVESEHGRVAADE